MRFDTLEAWLAWQETLNPRGIDLGLDRVRAVLERLELAEAPYKKIVVGGTNGKGSVAAYLDSMLRAAGYSSGRYLSPHILHYNERITVDGVAASDAELCEAFERVDSARDDTPLTYFEFGTLAAFELFRLRGVDVAVLEVGLGGRLDAVNAVDPDAAVVVSVGLDHMDWLGEDIDSIAREKAGIYRRNCPAIFGPGPAPQGLMDVIGKTGASPCIGGDDYFWKKTNTGWQWRNSEREIRDIPLPPLPGEHQLGNAAAAIATLLAAFPDLSDTAIRNGIAGARLPGRLEIIPGEPEILLDVGHNPAAAETVAAWLAENPKPTHAVLAMLSDKDAAAFVKPLQPHISHWHFASLSGPRGRSAEALAEATGIAPVSCHTTVADALAAAIQAAGTGERVAIFGSFHTVGEAEASGLYSREARR